MTRISLLIIAALTSLLALVGTTCGPVIVADKPTESRPVIVADTPTESKPVTAADTPVIAADKPAEHEPVIAANTLADVKAKGFLIAGVRETAPPFGMVNPRTNMNEGYEIDFARYLAQKLGVKVVFKTVTAANRIPMLMGGHVDILAAAMTITPERAEQIDFSYVYFLTGQKFLAQKGMFKSLKDVGGKKIGTAKGSTAEKTLATIIPAAMIVSFDDYPKAINALRQSKIQAVTTDEAILAGQLSLLEKNPATRGKYEIPELRVSTVLYGLGIRKNDKDFLKFVNQTLLEMEQNGEANKIFNRWFGPQSECPINRSTFMITENTLAGN